MKQLPNIGEHLVVHRMSGYDCKITNVSWCQKNHDWLIQLDWGKYGTSRAWARDEGKVWYRLKEIN